MLWPVRLLIALTALLFAAAPAWAQCPCVSSPCTIPAIGTSTYDDGYMDVANAGTYNLAHTGPPDSLQTALTTDAIGQIFSGGVYSLPRTFLAFDTRPGVCLPLGANIQSAQLQVMLNTDGSISSDFTIQARDYNWTGPLSLISGDFSQCIGAPFDNNICTTGTDCAAVNSYSTSSSLSTAWVQTAYNANARTQYCLVSNRDVNQNIPTGFEYVYIYSANASAGQVPNLVLQYVAGTPTQTSPPTATRTFTPPPPTNTPLVTPTPLPSCYPNETPPCAPRCSEPGPTPGP